MEKTGDMVKWGARQGKRHSEGRETGMNVQKGVERGMKGKVDTPIAVQSN